MTQKLTPNQAKWIAALRSGRYEQTAGRLHDCDGHCCLGVAAQEFISDKVVVRRDGPHQGRDARSYDGDYANAPAYVVTALGLHTSAGSGNAGGEGLTSLNDRGVSFKKIADVLEACPDAYFKADHTA
jgi:hypothetical protein